MRIEDVRDTCTGCTACMHVCPKHCITMGYDEEGFLLPQVDVSKCVNCGACERACHCLQPIMAHRRIKTYYGLSSSEDVLKGSSSGGAFHCIASSILREGGLVIGAAFDYRDKLLKHSTTDHVSLAALQKSKYIESNLVGIFDEVQNSIDVGRKVLFCGAPCQVNGLKNVIHDPDGLLLTCDFVCHGVPSAILFREHLEALCKGREVDCVDFRPKNVPWESKYLLVSGKGWKYFQPYYLDSFYLGMMVENTILRKSCYSCPYRDKHCSDITLADFWKWNDYNNEIYNENGLSLLIANTTEGERVIEELEAFEAVAIDNSFSDYVYAQRDYTPYMSRRVEFYKYYCEYGFEESARLTYFNHQFIPMLKYRIKRLLRLVK